MSVMMVQTNCKLFYIQSKEIGHKTYYEETRELEKCQRELDFA